jgi:hypothetical protein
MLAAGDLGGAAPTVAAALAACGSLAVRRPRAGPVPAGAERAPAAAIVAGGVGLALLRDIHGPAVPAGVAAGGLAVQRAGGAPSVV